MLYGIGVCEGIAKAFKFLSDRAGLRTLVVVGTSNNNGAGEDVYKRQFRVNSVKTMNWISERVGRSSKNSLRPLITPEAIGMLENGQALICIRGRIKYVTRLPYYWKSYDHTGWQPVKRSPYRRRNVPVQVINLSRLCIEHQRKQHEEALKKFMKAEDTKKPLPI